jgi:hypothetical protein
MEITNALAGAARYSNANRTTLPRRGPSRGID